MKVTDKRMFTDDGELREEYRFLEGEKAVAGSSPSPPPSAAQDPDTAEPPAADRAAPGPSRQRVETVPEPPAGPDSAPHGSDSRFMDLIAMIAEPIAFLLGDAQLPDGSNALDLPRARLHIDMLAVLEEKTRGNVAAEETALLEGLVAQLRMRFVEKSRSPGSTATNT